MFEERFSKWLKWENRDSATGIRYPGIYVCSVSSQDISGNKFSWIPEIIYIGMTNSVSGLKGRLKQFDNTIIGKTGHGGADRVRYKHQDYEELVDKLFVAVAPFECDVKSNQPDDLRIMGEVAKFEYDCFAHFVHLFGELPEFNNKKQSPKYSLTIGRGISS
ncbi:MAG: hypothetical protein SCARUB_04960 [Candidatus Scalindua rubra]|uniref:GIY-YIG domain-containing protein n=1 Tax=Candidatus Scalindua rubra TaxID=1872076 RepID=A0A1E3X4N4_9BACT|nr:MAG: hypothetical protein SCARUB_04960 [Candidatus Scalindua rubra]